MKRTQGMRQVVGALAVAVALCGPRRPAQANVVAPAPATEPVVVAGAPSPPPSTTPPSPPAPAFVSAGTPVPTVELRLLAGVGIATEAAASFAGHRLRVDAGAHWAVTNATNWQEAALLLRAAGPAAHALWIRAGYQRQSIFNHCYLGAPGASPDVAQTLDLGLSYRHRFSSGHLVATDLGVERLGRDAGFYCNDSVISRTSVGIRTALMGQVALTRHLGVLGKASLRTAAHLLEVRIMPELYLGVAYEL